MKPWSVVTIFHHRKAIVNDRSDLEHCTYTPNLQAEVYTWICLYSLARSYTYEEAGSVTGHEAAAMAPPGNMLHGARSRTWQSHECFMVHYNVRVGELAYAVYSPDRSFRAETLHADINGASCNSTKGGEGRGGEVFGA